MKGAIHMTIAELQEKYNEAKELNEGVGDKETMDDLAIEFWTMIENLFDDAHVVYERSSQSEATYLQCATEVDEDGDIADYYTVRVATHKNGRAQDVNYIERDFEDMYHRLETLLETQEGLYCEWEAPQKSIDELLAEMKQK